MFLIKAHYWLMTIQTARSTGSKGIVKEKLCISGIWSLGGISRDAGNHREGERNSGKGDKNMEIPFKGAKMEFQEIKERFSTEHATWIIAYCIDTDSFFLYESEIFFLGA